MLLIMHGTYMMPSTEEDIICCEAVTHYDLVKPFSCIGLGQHWLRLWLDAVRQQYITWTKVDTSFSAILAVQIQWVFVSYYLRQLHEEVLFSILLSNLPGDNKLILSIEI